MHLFILGTEILYDWNLLCECSLNMYELNGNQKCVLNYELNHGNNEEHI